MNLITIIVPTYNRKELLRSALLSVIGQDMSFPYSWELIIVDDGSTDGSGEYIRDIIEKYPENISYTYQENGGVGKARNTALSQMNRESDYTILLDSDDELKPTIIRDCLTEWKSLSEIGKYDETLGFYFLCEDEYGHIIGNREILLGNPARPLGYDEYLRGIINIEMGIIVKSNIFLGKDALRFEEDIITEGVMWAKMWKYMGERNLKILILDLVGRLYRTNHTSETRITKTLSETRWSKNAIGNERILEIIGDDLMSRGYSRAYAELFFRAGINWILAGNKISGQKDLEKALAYSSLRQRLVIRVLDILPQNLLIFLYKLYTHQ